MKKAILVFSASTLMLTTLSAQDNGSMLNEIEEKNTTEKVTGTFKSTRVINAHSTEMLAKGDLDFRIMHRFGTTKNGFKDLFGLDYASMRLSFDYGLSNNLMVGIGRSTLGKELDLLLKWRLLQQTTGGKNIPFSIAAVQGFIVNSAPWGGSAPTPNFEKRSSYYTQLVIARKFNETFSMQLSPIFLRNNLVENFGDDQNLFGIGGGLRYKLTKRFAITADYHHVVGTLNGGKTNPLSLGVDIETGGHVFQLQFTNSAGTNEKGYLSNTTGDFFKGDFRFGFNLSRMFSLGKSKKW